MAKEKELTCGDCLHILEYTHKMWVCWDKYPPLVEVTPDKTMPEQCRSRQSIKDEIKRRRNLVDQTFKKWGNK